MNKQDFINKWNVVYKNKEQELEFASEMDTDLDLVISQLPASVILDEEIDKLRMVADLISRIYHYGNFKAETHNERKLEKLLNELGLYPTTENEILSRSILNHPPVVGEGEKCDCVIPKPKDPYDKLDKNICRDCNRTIAHQANT